MDPGDPFSALMRPPPMESDEDRVVRLQREAEAKRISESIDEQIRLDRERYKRSKEEVKVGTSATLSVRLRMLDPQRVGNVCPPV